MKLMKSAFSLLLFPAFQVSYQVRAGCISPTGVGAGADALVQAVDILNKLSQLQIPYLFLPMAEPLIGALVTYYETPIQFRLASIHGSNVYNVAAMYDDAALDIWGKADYRICSDDFASSDDKRAHETAAVAYAFAYSGVKIIPQAKDAIINVMENILELPFEELMLSSAIVDATSGTPWGLAKTIVDNGDAFAFSDGWNSDGSLQNTFNKAPYSDFQYIDADGNEYIPYSKQKRTTLYSRLNVNRAADGRDSCKATPNPWYWEPLLESDGNGYFIRQEHVTPFIGFTGRLLGLTAEEYEAFESPLPSYDYCFEADFVLANTANLALNDRQKMEVEFFDSKFTSLLPIQIQWAIISGFSEFEFWFYDMALVTSMYDATMLVWRDKVLFDGVRPTTVVHTVKGGIAVETYGGPYEGLQAEVDGADWQPYIRTMPHAEYPSGSSCICTTFVETLQSLTSSDELGITFQQSIPKGSSKIEPGATPQEDLLFEFSRWTEIQNICGFSREYGGMHFSQAVPAGEALCSGLGEKIVQKANLLKSGDASGALADFEDRTIHVKTKVY